VAARRRRFSGRGGYAAEAAPRDQHGAEDANGPTGRSTGGEAGPLLGPRDGELQEPEGAPPPTRALKPPHERRFFLRQRPAAGRVEQARRGQRGLGDGPLLLRDGQRRRFQGAVGGRLFRRGAPEGAAGGRRGGEGGRGGGLP
jgi:hypothetical protein